MSQSNVPSPASLGDLFMNHMFAVAAREKGGVIQRDATDIERFVGRQAFVNEIRERGFRAIENNGQIVIFCNSNPVTPLA